jgi:hypothetical protein
MKPIEPGCRAVCVHPKAMNMKCTVIELWEKGTQRYGRQTGRLYTTKETGWHVKFDAGSEGFFRGQWLIRIDDDEQSPRNDAITEAKVTWIKPEPRKEVFTA